MIEAFDVPPEEDEAFLAAWRESGPAEVLLRALGGAQPRFVALRDPFPGIEGGVWRIAAPGPSCEGRQGFLGVHADGDVEVQRWSSPLMVQRAGLAGGLYVAALP